MVTPVTSNICVKTDPISWAEEMMRFIKESPYWRDQINDTDKGKLRDYFPYANYILTQGESPYTFVIHYMDKDYCLQESEFSLELSSKNWRFINGYDTKSAHLMDILAYILRPH
jgi:hypothetical protein